MGTPRVTRVALIRALSEGAAAEGDPANTTAAVAERLGEEFPAATITPGDPASAFGGELEPCLTGD